MQRKAKRKEGEITSLRPESSFMLGNGDLSNKHVLMKTNSKMSSLAIELQPKHSEISS